MVGGRRFRPGGGFGRQLDEYETTVGVPPPAESPAASHGGLVDSAVYIRGHRFASPHGLAETYRCLQEQDGAMAWIGLYRPDRADHSLAREFGLHELAVEDAINAHQRPKLERYGDTLFVVLRAARYDDAPRRSSSASCTCSSGRTSWSPSGTARRPTWPRCGGGWRPSRELLAPRAGGGPVRDPRRRSSTGTRRWSPGWRTTSTRSRPRCSAATRSVSPAHLRAAAAR